MACSPYQRERCVAAEMEACWEPIASTAPLRRYDSESDPFCPLVSVLACCVLLYVLVTAVVVNFLKERALSRLWENNQMRVREVS